MNIESLETRVAQLESLLAAEIKRGIALAAELHAIRDYIPDGQSAAFDTRRSQKKDQILAELRQKQPGLLKFLEIP